MNSKTLWALRKQIILNSLFIPDYRNTFGIDPDVVCDFFDSYLGYLDEEMRLAIPSYDDAHFFDHLPDFDTEENLWNWYCCYEDDPLPIPTQEFIAA